MTNNELKELQMTNDELKRLHENELDNGSTTDTQQWCELHRGHCHDVIPVRRCFDNPNRQSIIFFACQRCIRTLRKAELIEESKYAGLPCAEIVVPRALSRAHGHQSYEVTLDALQVRYLRALGLRVIPA